MTNKLSVSSACLVLTLCVLMSALAAHPQEDPPVDFETQVRPVLAAYCYECHGSDAGAREADLRLDRRQFAFADLGGYHAIVAGEPAKSELYLRIASEYAEERMPPYTAGIELDIFEISTIQRWIAEGAAWPEDVDDRPPLQAGRAVGLPEVEVPERPVIVNTHEIAEVRVRVLARGLSHPWSMTFLPRGDILITERAGRLRLFRDGVLMPDAIEGAPTDIMARGLSGLMEVAAHPEFEQNQLVYLTYTRRLSGGNGTVALVRGHFDGRALRDVEDVFVVEPWMGAVSVDHPDAMVGSTAAARLAFAPDGKLFMSMGGAFGVERGDGTSSFHGLSLQAQDLSSYAGKLLRLNQDGSAPADNPFVSREGAKPEIYSMGHRNQQGLALHPETGVPFATEHGVQGGDELNAIEAGGNYGWPVVSYSRHYDGPRIAKQFWKEGFDEPTALWVPSIGPSGLAFYTGDAFPQWRGNLFAGSMRLGNIPRTGHVERIVFNDQGEELRRESLLGELRQRIRDVRQGPDGLIYLLTEENRAVLLRLEPVDEPNG
ncbi:MAG: PQQ-dependent sugar dehydrogenase [Acidobacteriota bacterium]|nr:PQQ-dependent sugar dehydrogenase [Acidobacteriota bacterium]